jgi:hypothetical protein
MEDALVEGYVIGDIEMRNSRTLYSVIGNAFVLLSGIACAYVLCISVYDRLKKKN